ncbi:MAG: ABC transporter ATP-binding protein [Spirochaetales bacterium]|nr:ABC transporter ATP-binding protein [Spirochaetales bacterium]
MNAIYTKDLCKQFGATSAVINLNIEIQQGEIFGFFGPNGSGKTTTVRLLNGILGHSAGKAGIFGRNPGDEWVRLHTSTMSENALMYENLSIMDNLLFYGRLFLIADPLLKQKIDKLLAEFGLLKRKNDKLGSFSTGMKKKVFLIRTLLNDPSLVFLDEPTSGLDPESAEQVISLIAGLCENHKVTVFLCTHNLEAVETLCSSLAFIKNGRLIVSGTRNEIINSIPFRKKVLVETSSAQYCFMDTDDINTHLQKLIRRKETIVSVQTRQPNLQDAYFHFIHNRSCT